MTDEAGPNGVNAETVHSVTGMQTSGASDAGRFLDIYCYSLAGEPEKLQVALRRSAKSHIPLELQSVTELAAVNTADTGSSDHGRQWYWLTAYEVRRKLARYFSEMGEAVYAADLLEVFRFPVEADDAPLCDAARFFVETAAKVESSVGNSSGCNAATGAINDTACDYVVRAVWLHDSNRGVIPVGAAALKLQYIWRPYPRNFREYSIELGQSARAFVDDENSEGLETPPREGLETPRRCAFDRYWRDAAPVAADSLEVLATLAKDRRSWSAVLRWAMKHEVLHTFKASTIEKLISHSVYNYEEFGVIFWHLFVKERWDALRSFQVFTEQQWGRLSRIETGATTVRRETGSTRIRKKPRHVGNNPGYTLFCMLKPRPWSEDPDLKLALEGLRGAWLQSTVDEGHVFTNPKALDSLARASRAQRLTKDLACDIFSMYAVETASAYCPPGLPQLWNQVPAISLGLLLDRVVYEFLAASARKFGAENRTAGGLIFSHGCVWEDSPEASDRDRAIDVGEVVKSVSTLVQNVDALAPFLVRPACDVCAWPTCLEELWTRHQSDDQSTEYDTQAARDLQLAFDPVRESFETKRMGAEDRDA